MTVLCINVVGLTAILFISMMYPLLSNSISLKHSCACERKKYIWKYNKYHPFFIASFFWKNTKHNPLGRSQCCNCHAYTIINDLPFVYGKAVVFNACYDIWLEVSYCSSNRHLSVNKRYDKKCLVQSKLRFKTIQELRWT